MSTMITARRAMLLRRAAVRATLAPSVHNTQPWTLHVTSDELRVHRDRSRQLTVLDPTGRQLLVSCGCAVLNARVALAAYGLGVRVERFPDASDHDLVARLVLDDDVPVDASLGALDNVVEQRQTNRRRFADEPVPEQVVDVLERVAAEEGADLVVVRDEDRRITLATLSQHADAVENLNPAYRAELRAWTTDDPVRRDGVPALAVPHVDGTAGDEVPIRDFDTRGTGGLPSATHSSSRQCLALVCTPGDGEADWLRAGEALERILLEVTRHGYVASLLTQVTEVPSARSALRKELDLLGYPHVLLRIGLAPMTPASRRRRLSDVLVDET